MVLVLDAERGISQQDKKLMNQIIDGFKSMLVFVNKSDFFQEDADTFKKDFTRMLVGAVPKSENYPIIYGSAKTGEGVQALFKQIPLLFESIHERMSTSNLNQFVDEVIKRFPAPAKYGKQVKIYYVTQTDTLPPTFVFFINYLKYLSEDYKRFLEKRIRTYLGGFFGHSLQIIFKERQREAREAKIPSPKRVREAKKKVIPKKKKGK